MVRDERIYGVVEKIRAFARRQMTCFRKDYKRASWDCVSEALHDHDRELLVFLSCNDQYRYSFDRPQQRVIVLTGEQNASHLKCDRLGVLLKNAPDEFAESRLGLCCRLTLEGFPSNGSEPLRNLAVHADECD
jgi:hypothetical protein